MKRAPFAALLLAAFMVVLPTYASPDDAHASVTLSGRAMGTVWSVTLRPSQAFDLATLKRDISARLEQLEQRFSTYRTRSELSLFNARASVEWIPVSPEMAAVASESQRISELTQGAFDVTVAPLVRLWGFGPQRRSGALPDESEIKSARSLVGWRSLEVRLHPPALRKHNAGLEADFSSLAKGFAADAISEMLTVARVTAHLVQIGGDTRTGTAEAEQGWRVAIERADIADLSDAKPAAVVVLDGHALSTSGDYRNFFTVDGQRYGHIIDPRTGRPATSSLAAVSVVHPSCATSSALATALFVLGTDEAFRFATQHRLPCLLQIREGPNLMQRMTPEFAALLGER